MHELGTFAGVYPCWAIVHKDSIVREASNKPIAYKSPMNFMVLNDKSGGSTFPAFTDADLADRFLKTQENGSDFIIVAVTSPRVLSEALQMIRGHANAFTFDQPKLGTRPYAIWPLEYAIERIEAGQDL